jgi:hypothetical protein
VRAGIVSGAALVSVCGFLATGCGASRVRLEAVRVSAQTPHELASLLGRPVRVPRSCHLTKPVYVKGHGYSLGNWPLRAIMDRQQDSARESFKGGLFHGWWYAKVLWFVPSTYRGWLLVRGLGLDRSPMGFLLGAAQQGKTALRLHATAPPAGQSGSYWSTATLVPHGGCYAYQVDGRGFSYSILVRAYR